MCRSVERDKGWFFLAERYLKLMKLMGPVKSTADYEALQENFQKGHSWTRKGQQGWSEAGGNCWSACYALPFPFRNEKAAGMAEAYIVRGVNRE